jgi:hypothetical protein
MVYRPSFRVGPTQVTKYFEIFFGFRTAYIHELIQRDKVF